MRNNESTAPLSMNIGEIELVVHLGMQKEGEIRGMLNGELLPVNIVMPSKNEQVLGREVREWFAFDKRIGRLEDDLRQANNGLAVLADFDHAAPWIHADQLQEIKQRKQELDRWFASQEFDNLADAVDPFLQMLAQYRSAQAVADLEDALEEVPLTQSGLFDEPDQEDLTENDTKRVEASRTMRMS